MEHQERILENTYVAVNVKTKKILSIKVTEDEHAHDSKMLPELVDEIIDSDSITTIGKLLADGASMKAMIFLDVLQTMESCRVLK